MKKINFLALGLFAALALPMIGCSSGSSDDTAAKTPPPSNDAQLQKNASAPQKPSTD